MTSQRKEDRILINVTVCISFFKKFFFFISGYAGSPLLHGLSPVEEGGGYSLAAVLGFLTAAACLAAEHGLQCVQASAAVRQGLSSWVLWLQNRGSIVMVHGLSRSTACEIFPDLGLNPYLLNWQVDPLPLSHQGSPELLNQILPKYFSDIIYF